MIEQQAELFLYFVVFGAVCALIYDLLRALRQEIHHGTPWLIAEDTLFSAVVCSGCYGLFFYKNRGALRAYGFLGMVIGALLYHLTLSNMMLLCFRRFFRVILFPLRWIRKKCKIWKSHRKSLTKQEG